MSWWSSTRWSWMSSWWRQWLRGSPEWPGPRPGSVIGRQGDRREDRGGGGQSTVTASTDCSTSARARCLSAHTHTLYNVHSFYFTTEIPAVEPDGLPRQTVDGYRYTPAGISGKRYLWPWHLKRHQVIVDGVMSSSGKVHWNVSLMSTAVRWENTSQCLYDHLVTLISDLLIKKSNQFRFGVPKCTEVVNMMKIPQAVDQLTFSIWSRAHARTYARALSRTARKQNDSGG